VTPLTVLVIGDYYYYTVSRKKETKMFFCNICYKTLAVLMKFGVPFPE